jgi:predicted amidophosphoribosyltransferase
MRDLLWPPRCAGCDAEGAVLCVACRATDIACPPLRVEGVRGIRSLSRYGGPISRALLRAKYGHDRALAAHLAAWFAKRAAPVVIGVDAIVPIPSPWTRRLWRGFSVSALMADALSRRTGIPIVHALRLRPGRKQAGLGADGRTANLQGRLRATLDVPGRVLLVDDVVTTGATARRAADELLGGRTAEVWLAVLCVATGESTPEAVPSALSPDARTPTHPARGRA